MLPILEKYLNLTQETEMPRIFCRWAFLSAAATCLGRRVQFEHGHTTIYPNMYVMLVGSPASRKSTAIKNIRKFLENAGYENFGPTKSSKQKFLLDWQEKSEGGNLMEMLEKDFNEPSEMFICSEEFLDFIGLGNFDFISLLTTMWDNLSEYEERVKNSSSSKIINPTLNLLGAATPVNLALGIPKEASGQGFMSRVIFIHSDPVDKKITFPPKPCPKIKQELVEFFTALHGFQGTVDCSPSAAKLIDAIYKRWENVFDVKLEYYAGRRLDHLLKLCCVIAACNFSSTITEANVIEANTYLLQAELSMDKALTYFGNARNLEASNKVLDVIRASPEAIPITEVWKRVNTYFEKISDLGEVVKNLVQAEKITNMGASLVAIKRELPDFADMTDFNTYLLPQER